MSSQSVGVERTLQTLLRSNNPAASDLLVVALGSSVELLRLGAVRAIALRDDTKAHVALIDRFSELEPDTQAAIRDVPTRAPLLETLTEQIENASSAKRAKRAAHLALIWRALGALPAIVKAAQAGDPKEARVFAAAAVALSGEVERALIEEENREPGEKRQRGEDPAFVRRAAVDTLGRALERYAEHQHQELIEALLLITPHDEPSLVRAIRSEKHAAHEPLLESLRESDSRGAMAVLANALRDPSSPRELLEIATQRSKPEAIEAIFKRVGNPIGARARRSMERVESFAWFEPARLTALLQLQADAQATAMQLAAASKASRRTLAEAVLLFLDQASDTGRRAASRAIERLPSHLAIESLAAALESNDPVVASTAARLLRKKDFPQAMGHLVKMLDNPETAVRQAAQRSLREISFAAFRDSYEILSEQEQRRAGKLVAKADPLASASLASELGSGAVSRRMRALEMIDPMHMAGDMSEELVEALEDKDAGVRSEAARLLGDAPFKASIREALNEALEDRSSPVRAAAEASLIRLDAYGVSANLIDTKGMGS